MPLLALAAAAVLLAANAFFVLVEFAIVSARLTRLEELSHEGVKNAGVAREILEHTGEYLSACQLGITMASLGVGWIGEPAVASLLEPVLRLIPAPAAQSLAYSFSFAVAFLAITCLHMIVGEQAPKYIGIQYAERALVLLARPMRLFHALFYTPLDAINRAASGVARLAGLPATPKGERQHSEEELRMLISAAEEQGQFPLRRLLLFENLFDFGDQAVRDVMTPRDNIVCLKAGAPWEENLTLLRSRRFSRFPLSPDTLEHASGYVHVKDLALELARGGAPDLQAIQRELGVVPEETSLEKALATFQNRRLPIALVRDGKGHVSGLVTLEDILEELTGEIQDEFEAPPAGSLLDYFVPLASDLDLASAKREEAIARLLDLLCAAVPEVNHKEALDVVMKREKALTTAIGSEVALPHGRMQNLSRPFLAIGRSVAGIDFNAPDKRPVKLLFLILTPAREPLAQLRALAKIAALVSNRALHRRLKKARTTSELSEILKAFDQTMPA